MLGVVRFTLAAALLSAGACVRDETPQRVPLVVFAASSLTEAFEALEPGFEAEHPQLDVQFVFSGSQVLRLQIEQGAAADVFASADVSHMDALATAGRVGEPRTFAGNHLVVIVPQDNPAELRGFDDLKRAARIVVGTPNVPVGAYTRAMLARTPQSFADAVSAAVVSEEANVRLVRAKVELGEADAAVVYRTDVSDRVVAFEVPPDYDVPVRYPIAAVADSGRSADADAFVAYVRSPAGQAVLRELGFDPEVE